MLYNKKDRVVVRKTGQAGKVVSASETKDSFAVQLDDGEVVADLRGAELAIERKR